MGVVEHDPLSVGQDGTCALPLAFQLGHRLFTHPVLVHHAVVVYHRALPRPHLFVVALFQQLVLDHVAKSVLIRLYPAGFPIRDLHPFANYAFLPDICSCALSFVSQFTHRLIFIRIHYLGKVLEWFLPAHITCLIVCQFIGGSVYFLNVWRSFYCYIGSYFELAILSIKIVFRTRQMMMHYSSYFLTLVSRNNMLKLIVHLLRTLSFEIIF